MLFFRIFLNPYDLTFTRLKESVSYFGFNARCCFLASRSHSDLIQHTGEVARKIQKTQESILSLYYSSWNGERMSNSVFELFPANPQRLLSECLVKPVSPWALDLLLKRCEEIKAGAAADFYDCITRAPSAEILRGRLFERQVLKYLDSLKNPQTFSIRSLSDGTSSEWNHPGSAQRVDFLPRTFTPLLQDAVIKGKPLHLVPLDPNFPAIDSVLYDPGAIFTFIQVTCNSTHDVCISGFQRVQRWLPKGTCLDHLRPSTVGHHWRLIFVVPAISASNFQKQTLDGDTVTSEWDNKVDQYVLGVEDQVIWGRAVG
jgi:hypothetical protein